jgi:3-dehydroquinate synthase
MGVGVGGNSLAGIDQEVVVTFRYPVLFTQGLFDRGNPTLRDVVLADGRARLLVVIDGGVAAAHPTLADDVQRYCAAHADALDLPAPPFIVPGGEAIKNAPGPVSQIRAAIDVHGVDRHSYVVAIGGGAVLDAVGYAAATAHRGVRLIRVPTTVLAQDDSGVGVKNGINAFGKKNFVGSFAPPHAVLNDFDLLLTLSDRDWRAGISEAMKVALLKDAPFFTWIEHHAEDLAGRSLPAMAHMVHRSAELHLNHIATSGDPFENGSSRPLDFGHWAAHKLEQLSGNALRHGEAVAVGLALDSTYSQLTGRLSYPEWRRIVDLLKRARLPLWTPAQLIAGPAGRPAFLDGLEEFREHLGGRLTVMLLERIGLGVEVHELDEEVVLAAAARLRREQEEGEWPRTALLRSRS